MYWHWEVAVVVYIPFYRMSKNNKMMLIMLMRNPLKVRLLTEKGRDRDTKLGLGPVKELLIVTHLIIHQRQRQRRHLTGRKD